MATETFLFTSESVNEGHPDKLADQVSGEGVRVVWGDGRAREVAVAFSIGGPGKGRL